MAHYYGTIQGRRGKASRLGDKRTGITVVAASWQGCVKTTLYHREADATDCALVELAPWQNVGTRKVLYDGPVNGMERPI